MSEQQSHFRLNKELRGFRRHVVRGEARLEPLEETSSVPKLMDVHLKNIGRDGAMFHCDALLTLESMWRLRIIEHGHTMAAVPVIIRFCQHATDSDGFDVGCQIMFEPFVLQMLGVHLKDLKTDDADFRGDFESIAV